jgi:hypothetical protein
MRKIDAVLLSALILYDYSAQSLVDSDRISLGHSFINNGFHDNKLTDPQFNFTPEFNDEEAAVVRGVKHLNVVPTANTAQKNISYYELAKVNPATASPAVTNETLVTTTETNEANISVAIENVENVSFDQEKVALNEEAYSSIEPIVTSGIEEHVINTADAATFDSDNDGVYDVEDKCAGIAGVARFEGCPVPDSDADGVNDEEDRCPMEKGSADGFGCPVALTEATVATEVPEHENNDNAVVISFTGDSKALSNEDFNAVLQITDILVRNTNAKVEVEGNTNNDGSAKSPVERVSNYFKDLGVNNSQVVIKAVPEVKLTGDGSKVIMRILQ